MFRTFRLIFAFVGLLAVAVFTMRLIGGAQPLPTVTLFTNPDGTPCKRPCLFGIEPGKTTREEAVALLKAHPILKIETQQVPNDDGAMIIYTEGKLQLVGKSLVIRITGFPNVNVVTIDNTKSTALSNGRQDRQTELTSLGAVISTFGIPDWFSNGNDGGLWYYFRKPQVLALTNGSSELKVDQWHISQLPSDKVVSISISAAPIDTDIGFKWCGFSSRLHPLEVGCKVVQPYSN